jgi:tetratricopeptide (TPR) repeat protein
MNIFESAPKQDWCRLAGPEIERALAKIPNTSILHFFMGGCYLDKKDYANAVTELRAAVKLNPAFARAEANLGRALMDSGDEEGAMAAFEHVSKTAPGVIDVHPYLIVLYSKADRPQDVIRECRKLLEIFPRNFGANFNLGRALLETGDAQGAIEPLKKAMEGEPQRPAPHAVLGDVYDKLGRPDEAAHERAEAERLSAAMRGTGQQPPGNGQFKPQ